MIKKFYRIALGWLKTVIKLLLPRRIVNFVHTIRIVYTMRDIRLILSIAPAFISSVRLGGEAGYVIPRNVLGQKSVCYCVGCGEDISFDLELIQRYDVEVFAFDPTPRSIAYTRRTTADIHNYHFYDFGIWSSDGHARMYMPTDDIGVNGSITNLHKTNSSIEIRTRRLSSVMKENGHSQIDLLKIDVEGAEHEIIQSIIDDQCKVTIVVVEFDSFAYLTARQLEEIRTSVNSLLRCGYRIDYIEGSNFTFVRRIPK